MKKKIMMVKLVIRKMSISNYLRITPTKLKLRVFLRSALRTFD